MKLLPTRNKDQKREGISEAMVELAIAFGMFATGGILMCLQVYVFETASWLSFVGGFVMLIGVYAIAQACIGLLLELTLGIERFVAILCCCFFILLLVQGYQLITAP